MLWAAHNGQHALPTYLERDDLDAGRCQRLTAGKAVHYTGGSGDLDAEGVTYADGGLAGGIYISTERNNSANAISRPAVLLFDPAQSGTSLTATREWNLTSDLPVVGATWGSRGSAWSLTATPTR